MRIKNNISALNTWNKLNSTAKKSQSVLEKLSSGLALNRAADGAAELAVSEKMRAKITQMKKVDHNITEGVALAQTADGAFMSMEKLLLRGEELLLQAANGTYDQQDREAIAGEINQICEQLDTIIKGSSFGDIPLFQGRVENLYHSFVESIDTSNEWGVLDLVNAKQFEPAPEAKPAELELPIKNVANTNDLIGKAFSYTSSYGSTMKFCFVKSGERAPSSDIIAVEIANGDSLSTVVSRLNSKISILANMNPKVTASIKSDVPNPVLKFTYDLISLDNMLNKPPYNKNFPNGDGVTGNKASISELEMTGAKEINGGPLTSGDSKIGTYTITRNLNGIDYSKLENNTLNVGGIRIPFAGKGVTSPATLENYLEGSSPFPSSAVKPNVSFTVDTNTGKIDLTYVSNNNLLNSNITVKEEYPQGMVPGPSTSGVSVTVTPTVPGTSEQFAEFEVSVGTIGHHTSLSLGGRNFYFFDSAIEGAPSSTSPYAYHKIDINGKSQEQILETLASYVPDMQSHSVSGGTITFKHRYVGTQSLSGNSVSMTTEYLVAGGSPQIYPPSDYLNLKPAELPIDFSAHTDATGKITDLSKLSGMGFRYGLKEDRINKYRLYCPPEAAEDGFTNIDISGCVTATDVGNRIKGAMSGYMDTVETDVANPGKITLKTKKVTTDSYYKRVFDDGVPGLDSLFDLNGKTKENLKGGQNISSAYSIIDFSSITPDNIVDKLMDTGFRVTCASCTNEYINVIFRMGTEPPFPENSVVDGVDIKNFVVDISNVTDSQSLVNTIVTEANLRLDHFTGFEVDPENPSALRAYDKRWGEIPDPSGVFVGAEVIPGIRSDFMIRTEIEELHHDQALPIFVGDDANNKEQWYIPIHLPYLSLENLGLRNDYVLEEGEDEPMVLLESFKTAKLEILGHHGTVGADYNRLEHAQVQNQKATVEAETAISRIQDADMAKESMELIKCNILQDAATAMLVHANQGLQNVLQLLT